MTDEARPRLGAGVSLFDFQPFVVEPPEEHLSADRRRTVRQAEAVARGVHPLALVHPTVRMHPGADATRTATQANAHERPMRCGTCRFREQVSGGANNYPKCVWRPASDQPDANGRHRTAPPRYSAGGATDVRGWWPACNDWQPSAKAEPGAGPMTTLNLADGRIALTQAEVGAMLRRARQHAGLTQQQLADRAGVNRTTISEAERGVTELALITRAGLALALAGEEVPR